jgi:hypothetical protein
MIRRVLVACTVAMALSAAPPAFAGEEAARAHFARGVGLYDAKDYAAALDEFRAAYAEKASPGIQRNIALCLRALHRYAEAIDALESMLAGGGDAIDARTREGAKKAIDEMSASVAMVRVHVILHAPAGAAMPAVSVRADDAEVPPEKLGALRLAAGEHTFRAQAPGFAEAVRRVTLNGGEQGREVTIEMVAITTPTSADAMGTSLEEGVTILPAPGNRPSSLPPQSPPPPPPPEYMPDRRSEASPPSSSTIARRWYGLAGVTFGSEGRTVGAALGETSGGASREFSGTSFTLRFGRALSPTVSLEALGEIGSISPTSSLPNASQIGVTTWLLAPELRLYTQGKVRLLAGVGFGVVGQHVTGTVNATTTRDAGTVSTDGLGGVGLLEVGAQAELGRVLAEADGIIDIHGVGSPMVAGERVFLDSPATRVGVRFMLGYAF